MFVCAVAKGSSVCLQYVQGVAGSQAFLVALGWRLALDEERLRFPSSRSLFACDDNAIPEKRTLSDSDRIGIGFGL